MKAGILYQQPVFMVFKCNDIIVICIHVCGYIIYPHMWVCMYTCTYIYMHIYIYICIYFYIFVKWHWGSSSFSKHIVKLIKYYLYVIYKLVNNFANIFWPYDIVCKYEYIFKSVFLLKWSLLNCDVNNHIGDTRSEDMFRPMSLFSHLSRLREGAHLSVPFFLPLWKVQYL